MSGSKWTAEEESRLKAVWFDPNVSIDKMGGCIGRVVTKSSISQKAKILGLPPRHEALGRPTRVTANVSRGAWSEEDDTILKTLWANPNYAVIHIAALLPNGRGESAVSRRAQKLKLPNRRLLFQTAKQARPLKAKPPQTVHRGCAFPLALVPRIKTCGKTASGRFCETHATLMELTQ